MPVLKVFQKLLSKLLIWRSDRPFVANLFLTYFLATDRYIFGRDVTDKFLWLNGLSHIVRAIRCQNKSTKTFGNNWHVNHPVAIDRSGVHALWKGYFCLVLTQFSEHEWNELKSTSWCCANIRYVSCYNPYGMHNKAGMFDSVLLPNFVWLFLWQLIAATTADLVHIIPTVCSAQTVTIAAHAWCLGHL